MDYVVSTFLMLLKLQGQSLLLLQGNRVQLAKLDVHLKGKVLESPFILLALILFLEDLDLSLADVLGKLSYIRFLKIDKLNGDLALYDGINVFLFHVLLVADLLEERHKIVLHSLGTLRISLNANSDLHQ